MDKHLKPNRTSKMLGWTLLGLLLVLLALEGWRYGIKPSDINNKLIVQHNLSKASEFFLNKQKELLNHSKNVGQELFSVIQKPNKSQADLYRILHKNHDFWGSVLYKNDVPLAWNGFAFEQSNNGGDNQTKGQHITLKKNNNVTYWKCNTPFSLKDSTGTTNYNLVSTYRIKQRNPLSIGKGNNFDLFKSGEFKSSYPVDFNIFGPVPNNIMQKKALVNVEGDSVGIVYATTNQFNESKAEWEQNTRFWRSAFAFFSFIILIILVFVAADSLSIFASLSLQLIFICLGWAVLSYSDLSSYWILKLSDSYRNISGPTFIQLSDLLTNIGFALVIAIVTARKLNAWECQLSSEWYITYIIPAVIAGIINVLAIPVCINQINEVVKSLGIPVMNLHIIPAWPTVLLYMAIGMAFLTLGIVLYALNNLIFRLKKEFAALTISALCISFVIGILVAQLYIPTDLVLNWVFYTSILFFIGVTTIAVLYFKFPRWVGRQSTFRKIIAGSLLLSLPSIVVIYEVSSANLDKTLWNTAERYSQKTDATAEQITGDLLSRLEQNFHSLSSKDLVEERSTIQAQFTKTVKSFSPDNQQIYSFDIRMVDPSGTSIAEYSTDLNSPDWVRIFDIPTLKAVTELQGIDKTNIRPVVQLPQLVNQEKYQTFYRGWIPIFGASATKPIAWIIGSVYKELPNFNKPIRAVMASADSKSWEHSFLMQRFKNGVLSATSQQGFSGFIPNYQVLKPETVKALKNDSLIYFTEHINHLSYRALLWKKADKTTIKVSSPRPGYQILLFNFFRFNFTFLLAWLIIVALAHFVYLRKSIFFKKDTRFQNRILDNFLMATLVFLAFLIIASQYTIKKQNQNNVRQDLYNKLENLGSLAESNPAIQNNGQFSLFSLDSLTIPLDVDASFYRGAQLAKSTTPQIFQQHLLPSVLPFNIFEELFIKRKQDAYSTVKLAGQKLLIGYRALKDKQNKPIAAIAIPTFLESPKYNKQLLETTSYLILFYLLVFGLFIIGAVFISKRLTRPLAKIQKGLNKISSDNLSTTISSTTNDEIGNLADAYNEMVDRLAKLQKELASAEREAAWKEMAQQVAHEIKNPLTPMKLNVQHLQRQLKSDNLDSDKLKEQIKKLTSNLIEQIQTLNNIAADFSRFSQPMSDNFEQVNLYNILSSVTQLYEHDDNVGVAIKKPEGDIMVQGIADELKRVLINMLKNAYEAMPEGGTIKLEIYSKQQHAFIEIEDNGIGIDEKDRPDIFVPNFSTKSSGTGLGLAICKKIIEAHEGSISFFSIKGKGTTFIIKIPQHHPSK